MNPPQVLAVEFRPVHTPFARTTNLPGACPPPPILDPAALATPTSVDEVDPWGFRGPIFGR